MARVGDALERRSGATILVLRRRSEDVRRMEGPAAAVWDAARSPIAFGALVELARRQADDADGVDAETVAAAVDALALAGLVEVVG